MIFTCFSRQGLMSVLFLACTILTCCTDLLVRVHKVDAILRTPPDLRFIAELNQMSSQGKSVRLILSRSWLDSQESLLDQLNPEILIRFLNNGEESAQDVLILSKDLAVFSPDFNPHLRFRFVHPVEVTDPLEVAKLQERFLELLKSTSAAESNLILTSLNIRSENSTIAVSSGPVSSAQGFVASRTSKVYHPADSGEANRILPANRIYFATEAEAIASGRRAPKR